MLPSRVQMLPRGVQMLPRGVQMLPSGVQIRPRGVQILPRGVQMRPRGDAAQQNGDAAEWVETEGGLDQLQNEIARDIRRTCGIEFGENHVGALIATDGIGNDAEISVSETARVDAANAHRTDI